MIRTIYQSEFAHCDNKGKCSFMMQGNTPFIFLSWLTLCICRRCLLVYLSPLIGRNNIENNLYSLCLEILFPSNIHCVPSPTFCLDSHFIKALYLDGWALKSISKQKTKTYRNCSLVNIFSSCDLNLFSYYFFVM